MPAWVVPAMMAGSALMGAYGGKQRAKNPPVQSYNNYSQATPWDFNSGMQGNQGTELLQGLLGGYGRLFQDSANKFSQRPQGNPLGDMLSQFNSEFYGRRGR